MKKKTIIIIVVVVVVLLFGYFQAKKAIDSVNQQMEEQRIEALKKDSENKVNVSNEIIFTGKVAPKETTNYFLNPKFSLDKTYVIENQEVSKDTALFSYFGRENIDNKIQVLEYDFIKLKDDRDYYYTKIDENKGYQSEANESSYADYLNREISKYEALLAQNKIDFNNKTNEIKQLKNQKNDYTVQSEYDAFVYQINNENTTTSPYMIIHSLDKIVKIQVGEYELQYLSVNDEVKIEIEGLQKEFTGTIQSISIFPNNMESSDSSYFDVEINIPRDIPYGYSAIITVSTK